MYFSINILLFNFVPNQNICFFRSIARTYKKLRAIFYITLKQLNLIYFALVFLNQYLLLL